MIRVAVSGAAGKVGREVVAAVAAAPDLELAGLCDLGPIPEEIASQVGSDCRGSELDRVLAASGAAVVVDFTNAAAGPGHLLAAAAAGVCPVVGTTGFSDGHISALGEAVAEAGVGGFLAPNFAIGAVLQMQMCALAARYFDTVEVIELHHDQKIDAPSGTALATARRIAAAAGGGTRDVGTEKFAVQGVRGGNVDGVKVHSVRLPGLVAHQEVIFGGTGQTLTLRHDSISRESFMPGVLLAVRRVQSLSGLVIGLENLLD